MNRYKLVSHTTISYAGDIRSQVRGDFAAWGTLVLDDGTVDVDITIRAGGKDYPIKATGNYTLDHSGAIIHVDYDDGKSHSGVLIQGQPYLITLAQADGWAEVNVWRPENGFEANQ